MTLEFFFDCSSPWTYLAFEGVQPIAERHGVAIDWRPILVGGVFNTVNREVYSARANPNPRRAAYTRKDLMDWARLYDLKIGWPEVFPVNSVKAMRGAYLALDAGVLVPYVREVFKRYWTDLVDISQDDALADIASSIGFSRAQFFDGIASQSCKDRLRQATEEVVARGGYGSPTLFLDGDDMYFGNDRIDLMRSRITL